MEEAYSKLENAMKRMKCNKCGAVMRCSGSGEFTCTECGEKQYDEFGTIKKYLREHGPATREQIVLDTGISASYVNRFLREQRLTPVASTATAVGNLTCVVCGAKIAFGSVCAACRGVEDNRRGYDVSGAQESADGKMRFMGRKKK